VTIAGETWGTRRLAAYVQRLWPPPRLGDSGPAAAGAQAPHAPRAGLLTERTRQAMWRLRHGRTRHVAAAQPAELVCLDTFYLGQLKVVGKVW
jgi:hypothetical protein